MPKGRRPYPSRLTKHLRKRSQNKDDIMLMYMEWKITGEEDIGGGELSCPCGKQGIRNIVHITNKETGKATRVGTTCGQWFDQDMKDVLRFTNGLDHLKITGQFFGTFDNAVTIKHKFRVDENESLVRKAEFLRFHLDYVPVYDREICQIQVLFPREPDLEHGRYYRLRLRGATWDKPYGTGTSFRVIRCSPLQR